MKISSIFKNAGCKGIERLNNDNISSVLQTPTKTISIGISGIRYQLESDIDGWMNQYGVNIDIRSLISDRDNMELDEKSRQEIMASIDRIDKLLVADKNYRDIDDALMAAVIGDGELISGEGFKFTEAQIQENIRTILKTKQDMRVKHHSKRTALIAERNLLRRALVQNDHKDYLGLLVELACVYVLGRFWTEVGEINLYDSVVESYFQRVDDYLFANVRSLNMGDVTLPKLREPKNLQEKRLADAMRLNFLKDEVKTVRRALVNIFIRAASEIATKANASFGGNGYYYVTTDIDNPLLYKLLQNNIFMLSIYGDVRIACYNFDRGVYSWE